MDNKDLIINRLSLKYGISKAIIKDIVDSQFEFTIENIGKVPLAEMSIEEIQEAKTTYRFMGLGALHINIESIKKLKKKKE